jgi:hypothetical protein
MKFSLASIPFAILASAVTAQGPGYQPSQPGYQGNQGSQGYPSGQYQPYQQNFGGMQQGGSPWPNVPDYEVKDWQSCTNQLLNAWNDKVQGSGPACNMWNCLHTQASKYGRGGALTAISNVLNPICGFNDALNFVSSPSLSSLIFKLVKSDVDGD